MSDVVSASRFIPEASGAVLDARTGLREWYTTRQEAIDVAERLNRFPTHDVCNDCGRDAASHEVSFDRHGDVVARCVTERGAYL